MFSNNCSAARNYDKRTAIDFEIFIDNYFFFIYIYN